MQLPTFPTKAEVPAAFAALYEEKDGVWQAITEEPDTTAADALAAESAKRVAAEKNAIKAANELKKLQTKLQAAELGVTDDALTQARKEAAKEAEDERDLAVKALADERDGNRRRILTDEFKTLAASKGFVGKKLDDLAALHASEYDLTDDRKLLVRGKPGLDPAKHMESIAKIRPEWVEGTKASGSGASGDMKGSAGTTAISSEDAMKNPSALFELANSKQ